MNNIPTVFFSDGTPAPYLMTLGELIRFLRLDVVNVRFPEATVRRYRDQGLLRGVQVSKQVLFALPDVLEFIQKQGEAVCR